jgi:hypothetical protein
MDAGLKELKKALPKCNIHIVKQARRPRAV